MANGTTLQLEKFSKPVTIRLSLNENFRQALAGIYYIADDGSLEYAGGTYASDWMTAEVSHFGMYAILNYDKSFSDVIVSYWAHDVIKKMDAKQIIRGKLYGICTKAKRDQS